MSTRGHGVNLYFIVLHASLKESGAFLGSYRHLKTRGTLTSRPSPWVPWGFSQEYVLRIPMPGVQEV